MLFSVSLICKDCDDYIHASLIEKPHGHALLDEYPCERCGRPAKRLLNSNFSKSEISEKVHGGEVKNGNILRRYTGWDEAKRQEDLDYNIQLALQKKNFAEAKEMKKELGKLTEEAKKNL